MSLPKHCAEYLGTYYRLPEQDREWLRLTRRVAVIEDVHAILVNMTKFERASNGQ